MSGGENVSVFEFSDFRLDRRERRLTDLEGTEIVLRPKVFDMLALLVANAGRLVEKTEVFEQLWPGIVVEENNLSQAVSTLRRVLGDCRETPRFIATVQGRGYRFVAPVRPVASDEAPPATESAAAAAAAAGIAARDPEAPLVILLGHLRGRAARIAAAAAVLILAAAGITGLVPRLQTLATQAEATAPSGSGETRASPFATRTATLAVLPFVDMSERGDQGYLADGLTEEMIERLGQVQDLRVTGRTSSFAFKGRSEDLRAIGETLGVEYLVEGSVRRSGDNLRITAQLVGAADGFHLWSESYNRDAGDIFEVQRDIAAEVAASLSLRLYVGDPVSWTRDPEAHDLVLRAREIIRRGGEEGGVLQAEELLRAAVARDPDYLTAWAGLAEMLAIIGLYVDPSRTERAYAERDEIIDRLIADSRFKEAPILGAELRFAQALFDRDDVATARRMLELARESASSAERGCGPCAAMEAALNLRVGRPSAALAYYREAVRADPLSLVPRVYLAQALYATERVEEAEAEYRRSRDLEAAPVARQAMEAHALMVAVREGYAREVVDERAARMMAAAPPALASGAFDVIAHLDDREAALEGLRRELARHGDPGAIRTQGVAWWADHFEDTGLAIEAIHQWLDREGLGPGLDLFSPLLANTRGDPRFKEIVRERGYYDYWKSTGEWSDFCRPVGEDDFECDVTPERA